MGGPIWTSGMIDGALDFDGVDDYVEVPHSTSLDFLTAEFSIETWVMVRSLGDRGQVVVKEGPTAYDALVLGAGGNGQWGFLASSNGSTWGTWVEGGTVQQGCFQHIVVTQDSTAVHLYVDGVLVASDLSPVSPAATSLPLHIGRRDDVYTTSDLQPRFFDGVIDDVAMYNRTLSAAEILARYEEHRNEAPIVVAPLGDVLADEDDPDEVIDISGVFSDPDGDALTLSATSNDESLVTAAISGTDLILHFLENQHGSAAITVMASDGADSVSSSFTVTITEVNDPPIAWVPASSYASWEASTGTFPQHLAAPWTLTDSATPEEPHFDGDLLVLGTDPGEDMYYRQLPAVADLSGSFYIEARMRLRSGASSATGRAPVMIAFTTGTRVGSALLISVDSVSLNRSASTIEPSVSVDTNDALHTYRIEHNTTGDVRVYQDGTQILTGHTFYDAGFNTATMSITWGELSSVAYGTSEWEFFRFGTLTVPEDGELPIDVFTVSVPGPANESGQTLTVVSASAAHGAVSIEADGTLIYVPDADYHGQDTITYTIEDDGTTDGILDPRTDTASLTVNVRSIDDAPRVVLPLGDIEEPEDADDRLISLAGVFSDPDGDALTYSATSSDPTLVTATVSGTDLTLDFQDDQHGVTEITVRATDPSGKFVEDVFTVTVTSVLDGAGNMLVSGDAVSDGERLIEHVSEIVVTFPDEMMTSGAGSVTDPANWLLTSYGSDITDTISSITWRQNAETGINEATLTLTKPLTAGAYSLTAKGTILDAVGDPMVGGDFTRSFRIVDLVPIGPETRVNTYTSWGQNYPRATYLPNGEMVAVWESGAWYGVSGQDGSEWGIYQQRYDVDGRPIGGESRVNQQTAHSQIRSSVAADGMGNYIVVWQNSSGTDWRINARRFAANGTPLGNEFRVNSLYGGHQSDASVAAAGNGKFIVTWLDQAGYDGSGWGVFGRLYDASGTAINSDFSLASRTSGTQQVPRVAMDIDGNFVVTWMSDGQDGSGFGVYAQRFDAAGNRLGEEFQVHSTTAGQQGPSDVAMDQNGDFVIAWYSVASTDHPEGIYAQLFDRDGVRQGNEFQVNVQPQVTAHVAVAMDADGDFAVSWRSATHDGNGQATMVRRFNRLGEPQGDEVVVNTTISGNQYASDVAMNTAGDFTVLWYGNGPGDGDGAFMQRFGEAENKAPVVVSPLGNMTVFEDDEATVISLAGVFSDPDGDTLTLSATSGDETLVATSVSGTDLTLHYLANQHGSTTITVTASDRTHSASNTFTVTVNAVNDPPTVSLQNATTTLPENADTATRVKVADIVVEDDDTGTNNLSLAGVDADLFEIDTNVLYLKAGTFLDYEMDSQLMVTVAVDDPALGTGPEDSATLTITITDVNEAPTAFDDVYSTGEDRGLVVDAVADGLLANDDDIDGDALTASLSAGPEHGSLQLNDDGTFTYTPARDFYGVDTFIYVASDGTLTSEPATVTISVLSDGLSADFSWNPEAPIEGAEVTFVDLSTSSGGTIATHVWEFAGAGPVEGADPVFAFPDDGMYTVSLTVTDDQGSTETASRVVAVSNAVPVIDDLTAPQHADEGSEVVATVQATDPAGDHDQITFSWTVSQNSVPVATGTGSTVRFTPADDGEYLIAVVAADEDGGESQPETHVVVVRNVDPEVFIDGGSGTIDSAGNFSATGYFVDPGDDSWSVAVDFGDGTVANSADGTGRVVLNPDNTFSFSHQYTFGQKKAFRVITTVTDDDGGTWSVKGNKLIVIGSDGDDSIKIKYGSIIVDFGDGTEFTFADPDDSGSDIAEIVVLAGPGHDLVEVTSEVVKSTTIYGGEGDDVLIGGSGDNMLDGGGGDDTLVAGPGTNLLIGGPGSNAFEDGGGQNTFALTPGSSIPEVFSDRLDTQEDSPLLFRPDQLWANDVLPAATTPSFEFVATTLHGQLELTAHGAYHYQPEANFAGQDGFSYRITVDGQTSSIAHVTIDVANLVDLAGTVFDDLNNNGSQDPGEPGIAGATLTLFDSSDAFVGTVDTAADGSYILDVNLRPGTYQIVQTQPSGYLDGSETAGSLGGTVQDGQDNNAIVDVTVTAGSADGVGYNFAEIRPSRIQGLVWEDGNNNGLVDMGERAVEGVQITLTGTDDRGAAVDRVMATDLQGIYEFLDLRPGLYTVTEQQPLGYVDGIDTLGTISGVPVGNATVDDVFSELALTPGSDAINYNFGERNAGGEAVQAGQTATIGFWQNKNGQKLITSLNGSPEATALADWLAREFPNMYGHLAGKTNADVASYYRSLFKRNAKTALGGGPPKLDAQVMALALAAYVTNQHLAGSAAEAYGFLVTEYGVGASTFDVGDQNREAFGLSETDNTMMTIFAILRATDQHSADGLLYDCDGDGDADDEWETLLRTMANEVYSEINELGDI
jgi:hypothetical protein